MVLPILNELDFQILLKVVDNLPVEVLGCLPTVIMRNIWELTLRIIVVIEAYIDCLKVRVAIISFEELKHLFLNEFKSLEASVSRCWVEEVLQTLKQLEDKTQK
jgi:hypothetical protein